MFDSMTSVQKIFFGVLVVVALLVGILLVGSRQSVTPSRSFVPSLTAPTQPGLGAPRAPTNATPTISETDSVRIKGKAFAPALMTIKRGALVTWTNLDVSPHTVTWQGVESGALSEGAVWSHQFTKAGRYEYHCAIHPTMRGAIEVQ